MKMLNDYPQDEFGSPPDGVWITCLGHGSLHLAFQGKNIYIDPYGRVADYRAFPAASLVLLTHEHRDHLDPEALGQIRRPGTVVVMNEGCRRQVEGGQIMRNGDQAVVQGIPIAAVPAYNRVHRREDGQPFHPQGAGNGYVLTLAGRRIYIAGDTEDIPEMEALPPIDVAFLPMNLPYTMTPAMVARAARLFHPAVLYPYHFGDTHVEELTALLGPEEGIEVRIRPLA